MEISKTQSLLNLITVTSEEFGPDVTARQIATFLVVALAGDAGVEGTAIQKATDSSQAASSRNLTKLSTKPGSWGLVDFRVDTADRRRTLAVLNANGKKVLERILRAGK